MQGTPCANTNGTPSVPWKSLDPPAKQWPLPHDTTPLWTAPAVHTSPTAYRCTDVPQPDDNAPTLHPNGWSVGPVSADGCGRCLRKGGHRRAAKKDMNGGGPEGEGKPGWEQEETSDGAMRREATYSDGRWGTEEAHCRRRLCGGERKPLDPKRVGGASQRG